MKLIFMGTPDFAVQTLEALIASEHEVVAVYTQPDKRTGRSGKVAPPPVKVVAEREGIPVFQPTKLRTEEAQALFASHGADLGVVVAYGRVLPKSLLDTPRYGCINGHGSLLPKYRGAGPIQWALLNGETETGVTSMYMSEGLDEGDMILSEVYHMNGDENAGELHEILAQITARVILETVSEIEAGTAPRTTQVSTGITPTFAPMLTKEMSGIDFKESAIKIHNQVRGLTPWPSATFSYLGKDVKVFRTRVVSEDMGTAEAGTLLSEKALSIATGDGVIELLEVQMSGKKRVTGAEFLRGYRMRRGDVISEDEGEAHDK